MDGSSPLSVLRTILPKVPFMIKTIIWHILGLSSTSREWDLRTAVTVLLIRALICDSKPSSVSEQQQRSIRAPPVRGPMWISRVTLSPPPEENDVKRLLFTAIDQLNESDNANDNKTGETAYEKPELVPVEAEWTGYRAAAWRTTPEPSVLSEEEKYHRLMKEVTSDITILYVHGGALYLMDPATHRPATARHARLTGGRVLSVRYRLAPKYPFPAALLDVFVAYLSLLSPGADALHPAVPPSKIVFAGDSAGGTLIFALVQLLLHLRRTLPPAVRVLQDSEPSQIDQTSQTSSPTVQFNGRSVPLDLPAGIVGHSPWLDLTQSMPSGTINAKWDYLPPPKPHGSHGADTFPPCSLWPTTPPRSDLYAPAPLLVHPLASPLAAPPSAWQGAPPVWIGIGQEMLADEAACLAGWMADTSPDRDSHSYPSHDSDSSHSHDFHDDSHHSHQEQDQHQHHHERQQQQQTPSPIVHLNQYAHMPHAFGLLLDHTAQSKHYMRSCADFITACVNLSSSSFPSSSSSSSDPSHSPHSIASSSPPSPALSSSPYDLCNSDSSLLPPSSPSPLLSSPPPSSSPAAAAAPAPSSLPSSTSAAAAAPTTTTTTATAPPLLSSKATFFDRHVHATVELQNTFDIFASNSNSSSSSISSPSPSSKSNSRTRTRTSKKTDKKSKDGIFFSQVDNSHHHHHHHRRTKDYYTYEAVYKTMCEAARTRAELLSKALSSEGGRRGVETVTVDGLANNEADDDEDEDEEEDKVDKVEKYKIKNQARGDEEVHGEGAAIGMPRF
ncbi:hypothetical protein L228DRAFT_285699 [Xylona heveae TC161]|uniref:Alpha/beta hydrolase fold-3 domain-containing protein n=1 Tax=Xylona heveae (strain CBS 132557 / TC161) TaxID=1328760 RepID=A0A165A030_XYLHT|nr:hypothetical protein L228DRAFT_285699 [Xylona heveae TC161]KZF19761.1 hypothetical protein L228DRAFT_285699 [Xylona heveae TC161]